MMAIAVPQSDPFVLHSCYYQDFFLLRTSIIIGGYVPEIRVDDGVPVLHIPPDLRRLQCKDVAVGLPQISNKFAPILFRFGVYHVDTFYYVHFPLLSVMFFSRDNIKKFLSSLADNEVQPLLANELQRIITGNNSSILVKVECGLFLVTLHSSLGSKPKAHQVTLENYLQCIVEWEHSRVFHFESSIFDGKELGELKVASYRL